MDSNTDIGQMIASSPAPEGEVNLCKAERINDFLKICHQKSAACGPLI